MSSNLVNTDISTLTTEILILKQQTAQNIIEIGKRLIVVKENLPHGEWGMWLEKKVEFTARTAQRFMKCASEFSNTTAMSHLPPTKIFALLDLPQEEREEFVQTNQVDEMSTRELQQAVKERNDALKQLETVKRVAEEKTEEARRLAKEKQKAEEDARLSDRVLRNTQEDVKMLQETLEKERQDTKSEVERLAGLLTEARNDGTSVEKIKQLEDELRDAQVQVEELTEKLNEPVTIEAATIEKIPEDVQKELEDLRQKVGQQGNTASLKFKVYFDELVGNFKNLLGTLDEIQKVDEEAHGRYRNAILVLIGKMSERLQPAEVAAQTTHESPENKESGYNDLSASRYLDKNGRVIFVSTGLGGSEFGTFWESPAGGKHRVKTQAMPMTTSREEAQRNLDAWVEKNGLQPVEEGDSECKSA